MQVAVVPAGTNSCCVQRSSSKQHECFAKLQRLSEYLTEEKLCRLCDAEVLKLILSPTGECAITRPLRFLIHCQFH